MFSLSPPSAPPSSAPVDARLSFAFRYCVHSEADVCLPPPPPPRPTCLPACWFVFLVRLC